MISLFPSLRELATPFFALILTSLTLSSLAADDGIMIDDFNDMDLNSLVGWRWDTFAKNEPEPAHSITAQVVRGSDGNPHLNATGTLPDDHTGTSWGGVVAWFSPEKNRSVDLSMYYALAFRINSSSPGYYKVRLEQESTGYDSSNITFPVDDQWQDFTIPLSEFRTGVSRSIALAFTPMVEIPGARFHLLLDDVRLLKNRPVGQADFATQKVLKWAQSINIGWQEAQFQKKPMLLYFRSDFARPCQQFENDLLASKSFPDTAGDFILTAVNVNENAQLAKRYSVWRVPSFMLFDPANLESRNLYTGSDVDELNKRMKEYIAKRPTPPAFVKQAAPTKEQYRIVMIADFASGTALNMVGGRMDVFSPGDQTAIVRRTTEISKGNIAFEAFGKYPDAPGGTYGGIYCNLAPSQDTPRNISQFRWLSFIARSYAPGTYQVHLETGPENQSTLIPINVTGETNRISIPIKDFGPLAQNVTTIVWSRPNPQPGMDFHLVLDDIMVIQ